eukprot:PhM_4_TR149/c0_g1_i2/m.10750
MGAICSTQSEIEAHQRKSLQVQEGHQRRIAKELETSQRKQQVLSPVNSSSTSSNSNSSSSLKKRQKKLKLNSVVPNFQEEDDVAAEELESPRATLARSFDRQP